MLEFKTFDTATSILSGIEAMHVIKKEQMNQRDQSVKKNKNYL